MEAVRQRCGDWSITERTSTRRMMMNETVPHSIALHDHEVVGRVMVDCGVDINAKDNNERTVLHLTAVHNHEAVCADAS
jgi:hypothetical protein